MAKHLPGLSMLGGASVLLATAGFGGAAWAQPAPGTGQSYGNPQLQRELDYGTGKNDGGSLFNSANPIDLMNKLRKSSALDDATTPSDAVDAALKGLDAQPAVKPSQASVAGPAVASPTASGSGVSGSGVSGSGASVKAP